MSINNPAFGDYINIIYHVELEIKDTTDADHHASYLDLLLKYDNFHRLQVKLYDKRDDFNFDIVNFPLLSSNIPQSGACLNSEGSQVRRFSIPKVLKSENQFSNDISIGSVRLCPSRLKLLSMCIINVDKHR